MLSIYLLVGALLLLLSIFSSKLSTRFGIPVLLVFLGIGMIVGSDGLNWIYFDNYELAQYLGIIALIYILFSGGLDTRWKKIQPVIIPGISLSTLGVLVSALIVGVFTSWLLNFGLLEGVLVGAIVSSTDAAAVFSVLRSKALGFKYRLKELMEFESGTNDPMAIFLAIGIIQLLILPDFGWLEMTLLFFQQISVGLLGGYIFGKLTTWIINSINLEYDGLYPVLMLALVPLIYSVIDLMGGSGFLAVYIAGMVLGNSNFIHQRSLINFFDGLGWLMQITMFLTLGLLVFPTQIMAISGTGLLVALVLILVARPVSVFVSLFFSRFKMRSKLMISWTGLRGAVPIIMATFPLGASMENAELIFSIVFFVVVTSVLIQGPFIPLIARWLHVDSPILPKTKFPIEFEPSVDTKSALKEIVVDEKDSIIGKKIIDLDFPNDALIVIINREGKFLVPRGTTELQANDKLLVLSKKDQFDKIKRLLKSDFENQTSGNAV
ncbi:potassium/proton antiporter [Rhodohalobacter sp. 614A]|uniref:potassium/proton antiporter n=1 Tax=Rhodohalobacter sp. 614A TaxID=2908649 RepID=UPI001F419E38|nr:potassium/proton antiporter [Rhodohalobacter sp. 614A]